VVARKGKEKEKEVKEAVIAEKGRKDTKEREILKVRSDKVANREILVSLPPTPPPDVAPEVPAALQRAAFIRAEERPPVGETALNAPLAPEPGPPASSSPAPVDGSHAAANSTGKPLEKPLSAEKGAMGENLGDRLIQ
jgi:hypothetical protein